MLSYTLFRLIITSSILIYLTVLFIGVWFPILNEKKLLKISLPDHPQLNVSKLFIGFGFLIVLSLYSTMIYPTIPDTFGGGEMKIISFQFKDKLPVHLHDYQYVHCDTVFNYTQYYLVSETEKEYYILLDRSPSKLMTIPKESLTSSVIETDTNQSFIFKSNIFDFSVTIHHNSLR